MAHQSQLTRKQVAASALAWAWAPLLLLSACSGDSPVADPTNPDSPANTTAACGQLDDALQSSWIEVADGNDDKKSEENYLTNYKYSCFNGNDGMKNSGPGTEQQTAAAITIDGLPHVVVCEMTSDVPDIQRPWHGQCSVLRLNAKGPPTLVTQKQITPTAVELAEKGLKGGYNGERHFNHPSIASPDGKHIFLAFGSDKRVNNDTELYTCMLDHNLNVISGGGVCTLSSYNRDNPTDPALSNPEIRATLQARLDADTNIANKDLDAYLLEEEAQNDDGGASCVCPRADTCVCAYLKRGGRNLDDQFMEVSLKIGADFSVTPVDTRTANDKAEIARQDITVIDSNTVLYCAPRGNNRRPEDGVQCTKTTIKADSTFDVAAPVMVAPSLPNQKRYMNQVQMASCGGNHFMMAHEAYQQVDRKRGIGSTVDHLWKFDAKGENPVEIGGGVCGNGAKHGTIHCLEFLGKPSLACLNGSITGTGLGSLSFISEQDDGTWKKQSPLFLGVNIDAGYLSSMCGGNPGNQGRNFYRMLTAANPGFGVEGGFHADSPNLLIAAASGKNKGPKNSSLLITLPTQIGSLTPEAAASCTAAAE